MTPRCLSIVVAALSAALALGFAGVMSGPLVRSSYRAGRLYRAALDRFAPLVGTERA